MKTRYFPALLAGIALSACATPQVETAATRSEPVTLQILALNDFHGNLEPHARPTSYHAGETVQSERLGGAARLAATLAGLREDNSITVAAGDLIGASPLISSLFLDEPTIKVLSQMGLDLASVGNHEFDRGTGELRRMQDGGCEQFTRREPCSVEQFDGADFTYLAANVVDDSGETIFPGSEVREIGGARIGFIGMTLEGTANLVAAQATAGYRILDEAETANRIAQDLMEDGADTVVLLIHEGADVDPLYSLAGCPSLSGPIVQIIEQLEPAISVVVSGHTHQAYVCGLETLSGNEVLLTSAGRYGGFVTDITMVVDPATDTVVSLRGDNVPIDGSMGSDSAIAAVVETYSEAVGPVANRMVGPIHDTGEEGENCGDRPAQLLVADAYLYAAETALEGGADIAFVNTGGVRTDLAGADDGMLDYGELYAMAPFGNGVLVLEMTGSQIAALLEQQFCDVGQTTICDSLLIPSDGVIYSGDMQRPPQQRITSLTLDGAPLDPQQTYRVVTNSFLVGGGDGFSLLTEMPVVANVGFDIDALEAYVASAEHTVPVCGRVLNLPPQD
ncbi:bifunctional metallophosphatase/5'-nucleotidase [Aurantiacibacter gilvus]|uniref:Bifunctional metallophosphatase/5'-nucleotidase n=1 Tax=Aurantiacibacter gilvus TaxID=3139141 RepID=A0ABU9IC42_9SPHN